MLDLPSWLHFFDWVIRGGHLTAFLTGAVLGLGVTVIAVRFMIGRDPYRGHRERCEALERKLEAREAEHDRARGVDAERLDALGREARLWEARATEAAESLAEARDGKRELAASFQELRLKAVDLIERVKAERLARILAERDLDKLLNSDAKVWQRPVGPNIPEFRSLSRRGTPIVSVLNFKGGVGKTTITANLGFALAQQGYRVLLMDLDYQGSLTSLCASASEHGDILSARRVSAGVVRGAIADGGDALLRCVTRLDYDGPGEVHLVGCDDEFDEVETELMMRWHSGAIGDDVRFRLRRALHAQGLEHRFDIVLLDCPPRLTTGSVNALTASDYALIPALLDETSTEAVPRLLKWLKTLHSPLFPDLALLGVVGNRAFPRVRLIEREQVVWNNLRKDSEAHWGRPVRMFDEAIIRQHAATEYRVAALCPDHSARYLNLADCFLKELPPHVRRRSPGLPPFAVATR